MSEIALKACPFCGGEPRQENYVVESTVSCKSCRAEVRRYHDRTVDTGVPEAAAAWNIRAPQWQPIESAPKGQEVLVWRPDQGVFIAMIATPDMVMPERDIEECCLPEDFEEWYCEAWGWLEDDLRPTRWMPKPAEPEVEG
ncbi:Lar family restriction alleviation protein [Stenotrophomonas maltophilia]|uniref:Lar family restriction alleviation protein n=1 Tax=Stenotrophomonas maltophilia TaxID=40324 RepID=UPI002ACC654B|nr:Lar family restriction alleviation protein [Stenotrophomonas maltophilia]MDZ5777602.1 Lar family restriction alleviation protein [Stenotrophomonas maltophilia]